MNNLFKILPAIETASGLHLVAEADEVGISFGFFEKEPFAMKGLMLYQFEKNSTDELRASQLEKIFVTELIFKQTFLSVCFCSNVSEVVLIPKKYFTDQDAASMLSLQFANTDNKPVSHAVAEEINATLIYYAEKQVEEIWKKFHLSSSFTHSSVLQIRNISNDKTLMACIISAKHIKLFLYKNGNLQIIIKSGYNTPADVVYQMLNTCSQFAIEPDEVSIILGGLIEEKSALYQEIYKYFLQVTFDELSENLLTEEMLQYPPHYFSTLTRLAQQCVS